MPARLPLAGIGALLLGAGAAHAGGIEVSLEIPRLKVIEYHRPYVAVWLEREDESVAANLAVWYGTKDNDGRKWLADLRQWWRRSGRRQSLPIDAVTGATRSAGAYRLQFVSGTKPLGTPAPGRYNLVVEAVREMGNRELVRVPLQWPVSSPTHLEGRGSSEIGNVTLDLTP